MPRPALPRPRTPTLTFRRLQAVGTCAEFGSHPEFRSLHEDCSSWAYQAHPFPSSVDDYINPDVISTFRPSVAGTHQWMRIRVRLPHQLVSAFVRIIRPCEPLPDLST